jgi:hypothetical protein
MRNVRVILFAAAAIMIGALNVPAANAQLVGWGGGGGGKGGGGFSFGAIGKSGGFHGRNFSVSKGRFVGRGGFRHGHRHAHRFKHPRWFAYGWPVLAAPVLPTVVREPEDVKPIASEPPRVAEWKIYQAGTSGGCQSERVNVRQGAVTVFRC